MSRPTICTEPGCPELKPCPTHKTYRPGRGSTRRWRKTRARILRRDRGICGICGKPGADSVDHKVAVTNGGGDSDDNLQAAHSGCNMRKGTR